MSYLPELPPVIPPPRQMVRDTDWTEFFKRYMHDHPSFRDNLRAWINATNTTIDADAVTLADHETRIDDLEAGGGGGGLTLAKVSLRA